MSKKKQKQMEPKKPINVLATVFFFLFGLFSILMMTDTIEVTLFKSIVLFTFLVVAVFAAAVAQGTNRTKP